MSRPGSKPGLVPPRTLGLPCPGTTHRRAAEQNIPKAKHLKAGRNQGLRAQEGWAGLVGSSLHLCGATAQSLTTTCVASFSKGIVSSAYCFTQGAQLTTRPAKPCARTRWSHGWTPSVSGWAACAAAYSGVIGHMRPSPRGMISRAACRGGGWFQPRVRKHGLRVLGMTAAPPKRTWGTRAGV